MTDCSVFYFAFGNILVYCTHLGVGDGVGDGESGVVEGEMEDVVDGEMEGVGDGEMEGVGDGVGANVCPTGVGGGGAGARVGAGVGARVGAGVGAGVANTTSST